MENESPVQVTPKAVLSEGTEPKPIEEPCRRRWESSRQRPERLGNQRTGPSRMSSGYTRKERSSQLAHLAGRIGCQSLATQAELRYAHRERSNNTFIRSMA